MKQLCNKLCFALLGTRNGLDCACGMRKNFSRCPKLLSNQDKIRKYLLRNDLTRKKIDSAKNSVRRFFLRLSCHFISESEQLVCIRM